MRRLPRHRRNLCALRNQNRLRHPLIQRRNVVSVDHRSVIPRTPPMRPRIVKDPHHRRVPSIQYPRNPPRPPPIPPRRSLIHQHLIALHRAIQLIRRNKKIVAPIHASIRPDEPIPIAMQIEPSRQQPVPRSAMLHRHLHPPRFTRFVFSGVAAGRLHCSLSIFTSSPRAVIRASCSSSNRRSRPPPKPSSRISCLYPARCPGERSISRISSRSVCG